MLSQSDGRVWVTIVSSPMHELPQLDHSFTARTLCMLCSSQFKWNSSLCSHSSWSSWINSWYVSMCGHLHVDCKHSLRLASGWCSIPLVIMFFEVGTIGLLYWVCVLSSKVSKYLEQVNSLTYFKDTATLLPMGIWFMCNSLPSPTVRRPSHRNVCGTSQVASMSAKLEGKSKPLPWWNSHLSGKWAVRSSLNIYFTFYLKICHCL